METKFSITKDGRRAIIDIDGHIGPDFWEEDGGNTKKNIKTQLKQIAEITQVDTIQVNIDSLGGDVNHALSIHDLLVENPARVEAVIHGMTASAATIIAMSGADISISDNAMLLVHNGKMFTGGDKNDFRQAAETLETVDRRIANIYAKRTGKTQEFHLEQMGKNKGLGEWLTPEEAVERGYADKVFEPARVAASVEIQDFGKYNINVPKKLQMEELKAKIDGLKSWIQDAISNLNPASKPVTQGDLDNVKGEFETQLTGLEGQIDSQVVSNSEDLATRDQRITELEGQLQTANNTVQERDGTITDLQGQLSVIQAAGTNIDNTTDPPPDGKTKPNPFDEAAAEMREKVTIQ